MAPSVSRTHKNTMASPRKKKMKLRVWLESLLDKGACRGLEWKDRYNRIFTISWLHASRNGFDSSQADVAIRWAKYTGKFIPSASKGEYDSKYKSNFRSALRSLNDLIDTTKKGDCKGQGATRTFQFLQKPHQKGRVTKARKSPRQKVKQEAKHEEPGCSTGSPETSYVNQQVEFISNRASPPAPSVAQNVPTTVYEASCSPTPSQAGFSIEQEEKPDLSMGLTMEQDAPSALSAVSQMMRDSHDVIHDGGESNYVPVSMQWEKTPDGRLIISLPDFNLTAEDNQGGNSILQSDGTSFEEDANLNVVVNHLLMSGGQVTLKTKVENGVTLDITQYLPNEETPIISTSSGNVTVQTEPSSQIGLDQITMDELHYFIQGDFDLQQGLETLDLENITETEVNEDIFSGDSTF